MHEPLLSRAALPAATTVCGFTLRPYSLGHELFLIREESPFVFGGDILPHHLFEAIWICASRFEECRKSPTESRLHVLKLSLVKRRIRKQILKCDIREECEKFEEYRRNGMLEFPFSDTIRPDRKQANGRDPGAPFLLNLQQFLMIQLRMSEAEAWDYPYGLAKMRWASFWEQKGGIDVYNRFDAECERLIAESEGEEETCPA